MREDTKSSKTAARRKRSHLPKNTSGSLPTKAADPRWINWLNELDDLEPRCPRAQDWHEYSYFMFARYPRLRPRLPAKRRSKGSAAVARDPRRLLLESCRETFERQLSSVERGIKEHDVARRVLDGLNRLQRRQLAALVVDTVADLENYTGYQSQLKDLTRLAKEARRQKTLGRKVDEAVEALHRVRHYASKLHPSVGGDLAFTAERAITMLTRQQYRHTPESLRALRNELKESSSTSYPCPEDPATFGMLQLYWFFRHGCGLSGDESEVRTALIRNTFWPPLAKSIKVKLHYSDAESKGSTTVRQAAANFGRDRGKTL